MNAMNINNINNGNQQQIFFYSTNGTRLKVIFNVIYLPQHHTIQSEPLYPLVVHFLVALLSAYLHRIQNFPLNESEINWIQYKISL